MTADPGPVEMIADWNGAPISAVRSRGDSKTLYLLDYRQGMLRQGCEPWPPLAIVQKLVESAEVTSWFDPAELVALRGPAGVCFPLQSITGEDAVTWSAFGVLSYQDPACQLAVLNALTARVAPNWPQNTRCEIGLWRRIPYPGLAYSRQGSEPDVVLSGDKTTILVEVEWMGQEAASQGKKRGQGGQTQTQMLYHFANECGEWAFPGRRMIVLGIGLDGTLGSRVPSDTERVRSHTLHWDEISALQELPDHEEVRRYLHWKWRLAPAQRQRQVLRRPGGRAPAADPPAADKQGTA